METITGYKFIKEDMYSKYGNCKWSIGKWKKHRGKLKLCDKGLHASEKPLDAFEYVYGDRFFVVEARGRIIKDDDKFVASEMRLVQEINLKKLSVWFAIRCAKRSLKHWEKYDKKDKSPLEAIEIAEKCLRYLKKNEPIPEELIDAAWSAAESTRSARSAAWSAARSAAWSAAWSAARSAAWSAAWSAARSAAWSAARSAARSAAWSAAWSAAESARSAARSAAWSAARSAAWSAEIEWQNKELKRLIKLCGV
jgi:hypothetical protein